MTPGSNRIAAALEAATETRALVVGPAALAQVPELLLQHFEAPARIVADPNTWDAAGRALQEILRSSGRPCGEPLLLPTRRPEADESTVNWVRNALGTSPSTALAVGAGTLNDLCKRASFELQRPYMAVATAASVDGYASFGAPITVRGFKQTRPCDAPRVIVADTDVLRAAPAPMTAAGYADLAAKITGGSDWILADAVGADPVQPAIWSLIQSPLREWLARPAALRAGDPARLEALFEGLTLTGFAMQATRSSRPASGAEHLFAHVWEMSGLTDASGEEPSHGFKVALGTLATTALTEAFFARELTREEIEDAVRRYPAWPDREATIRGLFEETPLLDRVLEESRAKHLEPEALRARLDSVRAGWPRLHQRIRRQLLPSASLRLWLEQAGCPTTPQALGLTPLRTAATALAAQMIRERYTILDLAAETGRLAGLAADLPLFWTDLPTWRERALGISVDDDLEDLPS